ncbi:glycoside hydrolase family 55 protein [Thermothielavioides terrestris NRRL 8126]|uniref:Glycoside hydrolase family 55 protein n=2 Tax=Thermothielavioides terrestris TaxID=2587410 RepID=G2RE83_THETT|nr:glycoside hydrolase family 55 protein [Thermothielavioides terrestris NRRL 8126]AEO70912.1 glycoside hydrolase family 55 protein [Thermothielavioides terrestris NRRL 8126]
MKDNRGNRFGVAPDKGTLNGPVTTEANLTEILDHKPKKVSGPHGPHQRRASSDGFWVDNLSQLGEMPLAPSGYTVFRNVKDYGAKGDGSTDDTMAINKAISDGNRCGKDCGSTTTLGAIIYFPAGIYLISSPIIQYFYTQFIGDPNNVPIIRGSKNFTGIALIDTDVYIPGGNGAEWYINQNNFFRSIKNFNLDLTYMNATNYDNDQQYFPTGIHWQVAQATSLQNIGINMPTSTSTQPATAVGIFMENGSGGMISDIVFYGGNIGFVAGSQQFTARGLTFTNCLTAVNMLWNWGFTWSQITINNVYVGFNVSSNGGSTGQGTGSIAIIDSVFNHAEWGVTTHTGGDPPAIILENVHSQGSTSMVQVSGGATTLTVSDPATIDFWASGYRYIAANGTGSDVTGYLSKPPARPASLVNQAGEYFWQDPPLYSTLTASSFVVATESGVANDGTGDQTAAINALLKNNVGTPIFFPAGIYQVQGTVQVPVGSIIVGSAWSQIRGTGSYFEDADNPQVMVRVGNPGESGVIQISDMLFTVKGPTAGAILMEWNVHESTQGSAAMWNSHFRVGGATGSDLQLADCPTGSGVNKNCMAASLLLHLTPKSSGYFENVWAWVADHDLDNPLNAQITEGTSGVPENVQTDISVYAARGVLIESKGPCWFYGTASEHATLYQYELSEASDIYFGHVQTETPYYQPVPEAPAPFTPGGFPADPDFSSCNSSSCKEAWAMRIVESSNVMIYSAGFYSWFSNYDQGCLPTESCQQRLFSVEDSDLVWVFNLFTKGTVEIASTGRAPAILTNATTQSGYTSEINIWLPLAESGGKGSGSFGDGNVVYVDPDIWTNPNESVGCLPPCTLLFPPLPLPTPITVTWPPYGTGLYSLTDSSTVTVTTTISIPPFTISSIPFWPVTIQPGDPSTGVISPVQSVMPPSTTIVLPPGLAPISVTDGTIGPTSGATSSTSTNTTYPFGYITYSPLPPVFVTTSSTITIQPMPTIAVTIPPSDTPTGSPSPSVTTSHTVPYTRSSTGTSPSCTREPCGSGNCLFGCNGGCGLFGCNGGCGIFGCGGGGCGLFGCGGGGWNQGGCGPAGCGCFLGCGGGGEDGHGGGGCNGPTCLGNDNPDDECQGDDCECEPTKTVTSCRVVCTATARPTATVTGSCTTSTCEVTSCGRDTTVTTTTTTTPGEEILATAAATDPLWTEDVTAAFVTTIYSEFTSWWDYENSAAASDTGTGGGSGGPTTTTPAPTPSPWMARIYACMGEFPAGVFPAVSYFWAELDYSSGAAPTGTGTDFCNSLELKTSNMGGNNKATDYPATFTIPGTIHGAYSSCTYFDPSAPDPAVGSLTCAGLATPVPCPPITSVAQSSCIDGTLEQNIAFKPLADCALPTR